MLGVLFVASALPGEGVATGSSPHGVIRSCGNESEVGARLGRIAYLRGSELRLADLATCQDRVLARGARGPVRFSADGRYVAFGTGRVVSSSGGPVLRLLAGAAPSSWAWLASGHRLAAVTRAGGLVLAEPGRRERPLLSDGWGAGQIALAPDGSLTVVRTVAFDPSTATYRQEVWRLSSAGFHPRKVFTAGGDFAPVELAAHSPDGRWLLAWRRPGNSASLAADGLPLYARSVVQREEMVLLTRSMLAYPDFLSVCRDRVVLAAGADRYTTSGKRLLVALPPRADGRAWGMRDLSRDTSKSWVSPACSPDGRFVAAAAGPNRVEHRFGQEARSIWLLALDGSRRRKLTTPLRGVTDESPRWSRDGRVVLFVRSGPTARDATARGAVYVVSVADGRVIGPLAHVGSTANYYGHYGWPNDLDWFQPPVAEDGPSR